MPANTKFTHSYTDPEDFSKVLTDSEAICEQYEHYTSGLSFVLRNLYTYLIVGASWVFRTMFIWISELLGFKSRTK